MYVIVNSINGLLWSRGPGGWSTLLNAAVFTEKDRRSWDLPVDGEWSALWDLDQIQFIRLIAEAQAAGLFTLPNVRPLCDAMDVTPDEIYEVIGRAQQMWDDWLKHLLRA